MGAWVKVKCPLCTYLTHFHLRSEEGPYPEEIAAKVAILHEEHPKHPRRLWLGVEPFPLATIAKGWRFRSWKEDNEPGGET